MPKNDLGNKISKAIRSVVGDGTKVLSEPFLRGNEKKYVIECIDSGFISSVGKMVNLFEDNLRSFVGCKHTVAVSSGTAALHIGLRCLDVGSGDEVLIPSLTFAATANAVLYCGASPIFIDSELDTYGIDPLKVSDFLRKYTILKNNECINRRTGKRIKALICTHVFGHPCRVEELLTLVNKFKIHLVEDAAAGIGSFVRSKHVGNFGSIGIFSFNGNKIISTGGGGALVTQSSTLAKKAKHLSTTAKLNHPWLIKHDQMGFNYRLANINAAIGLAQLEQIQKIIKNKRALVVEYKKAFLNIKECYIKEEIFGYKSNYWLQCLVLRKGSICYRNDILKYTNENKIMTRPTWKPLHELPYLRAYHKSGMQNVGLIHKMLINIPSGPEIL